VLGIATPLGSVGVVLLATALVPRPTRSSRATPSCSPASPWPAGAAPPGNRHGCCGWSSSP